MSTDANARGTRPTLGHIRGLDGIRALSVLAIIAFHTGLNSAPGGFYGVDSFFVLSGFLITSLLVREWGGTGTIRLRHFWAGWDRRLLPALFLLIAVIGIVMAVVPRVLATPHVLGDALSTVFYVSNWYSLHGGVTYFSLSSQPSPLLHTWSLAIEEQFYLVWPLVVLGVLKVGTTRQSRRGAGRAVDVLGGDGWCSGATPAPRTTRRGPAGAGCTSSSAWPAWARWPRLSGWPSWRRTATPRGPTTAPGPRRFDDYVEDRYRQAVAVLGSRGASVVLLTTPYYDSGASPGHRFAPSVDQINVRCNDGVHFTRSGGIYVGLRLAPELAALGQAHAAASPGGGWPGPLAPSTPSWFSGLSCQ